jgi:hypothetical protein
LLICRQPGAKLIASGRACFRRPISRSNYQGPLKSGAHWRL